MPGVDHRWLFKANDSDVSLDTAQLAYKLDNLALDAKPKTSNGRGENAIDGVADGLPAHDDNEWAVKRDSGAAWITLTWPQPIKAMRILLYDRPNPKDQVLAGKLTFSDGSSLEVGSAQ